MFWACGCSVFSAPFIRDYSFPSTCSWLLWQKLVVHICVGLFLGSLFCSISPCVCFYANAILFYFYGFTVQFEIRKYDTSSFVLLSQPCLAIQSLLLFHTNFKCVVESWYFLIDFLSGWSIHQCKWGIKLPYNYYIAVDMSLSPLTFYIFRCSYVEYINMYI